MKRLAVYFAFGTAFVTWWSSGEGIIGWRLAVLGFALSEKLADIGLGGTKVAETAPDPLAEPPAAAIPTR